MTQQHHTLLRQLEQLVSVPSVSSTEVEWDQGNIGVINLLAQWLDDMGFAVQVLPLPGKRDKANLIATLGTGPGGLVFSGHTDTVPFDDARWNTDPFTLKEADGRLYGLGVTDMKGFFPIALEAARGLQPELLQSPLIILATADEESSMDGARQLVRQGLPKARYAVIGEPTGLRPVRSHKGIMMESVEVTGRSGHSSNPALGANALDGMHRVLSELMAFRTQLQQQYNDPGFEVAIPTMNLASIHGGDSPNRICGHCETRFDLRLLPGMEIEEMRAGIDDRLLQLSLETGLKIERHALIDGVSPFAEDSENEIIKAAEKLSGHSAQSVAFATEGPFLQQLGMQTVVMGPGSIDQAHQPDEHMAIAQINPAIDLLRSMIHQFCL